jgi:hypothetical protein
VAGTVVVVTSFVVSGTVVIAGAVVVVPGSVLDLRGATRMPEEV